MILSLVSLFVVGTLAARTIVKQRRQPAPARVRR
ncbi:hypothetical protein AWB79_03950 [Caballeronia hypogeia]|uniref:Uncharacterized protein n=1 Tax=Caballeronia hypogeia TaxID=1777140 RepID=A0A158BNN8_9BURK|nr:hypothetical protein AWB79_03950 [Caballeronia hypogeia]